MRCYGRPGKGKIKNKYFRAFDFNLIQVSESQQPIYLVTRDVGFAALVASMQLNPDQSTTDIKLNAGKDTIF